MEKILKFLVVLLMILCCIYCSLKCGGRGGWLRHIGKEYGHYIKAGTAQPYSQPEGVVRHDPRTNTKWSDNEENSAESLYRSSKNR